MTAPLVVLFPFVAAVLGMLFSRYVNPVLDRGVRNRDERAIRDRHGVLRAVRDASATDADRHDPDHPGHAGGRAVGHRRGDGHVGGLGDPDLLDRLYEARRSISDVRRVGLVVHRRDAHGRAVGGSPRDLRGLGDHGRLLVLPDRPPLGEADGDRRRGEVLPDDPIR